MIHRSYHWKLLAVLFVLFPFSGLASAPSAPQAADAFFLRPVADIPLPGPAVRFDYQSLDAENGRLYLAHMNADHLVVFDTVRQKVVANLPGFPRVHGVLVVPQLHRVYASVTGAHQVAVVDTTTWKTIALAGPVSYPDGLAYAPHQHRVFISDEHGGVDAVMDVASNRMLTSIPLGGGAGNTVYDSVSDEILVAVHTVNELVAIDPSRMQIVARYALPGIGDPHGIALDTAHHLAFVAGEGNHTLALFDLTQHKLLATYPVGDDPDVLAFDPGLQLLYVSAESGVVTVFREAHQRLKQVDRFTLPHAHTVSVDPKTHRVYLPLEDLHGAAVLRILVPGAAADKASTASTQP